LLDKKITSLCGPSPAPLASGGAEAGSDDLDLLGGSDNACANEVLSLFESTERIFDIEFRSELEAAGRERDVYQEMHEAGERERQELEGRILSLENQLRTERNKNAEELTLYDGSLAIANPQGIVTDDDRALIELGVEPVRSDALIEGGSRVTSKHKRELDVVRGQRDFLQREVEELRGRAKGAEEVRIYKTRLEGRRRHLNLSPDAMNATDAIKAALPAARSLAANLTYPLTQPPSRLASVAAAGEREGVRHVEDGG
jgi:hypothetical protein